MVLRESSVLVELEFGDVGFCGRRKTWEPGEKPSEQGKNQWQTQPTYSTGPELNLGHIGGRQTLWPLHLPCSPVQHVVILERCLHVYVPSIPYLNMFFFFNSDFISLSTGSLLKQHLMGNGIMGKVWNVLKWCGIWGSCVICIKVKLVLSSVV